jgi:hypothetical protein
VLVALLTDRAVYWFIAFVVSKDILVRTSTAHARTFPAAVACNAVAVDAAAVGTAVSVITFAALVTAVCAVSDTIITVPHPLSVQVF